MKPTKTYTPGVGWHEPGDNYYATWKNYTTANMLPAQSEEDPTMTGIEKIYDRYCRLIDMADITVMDNGVPRVVDGYSAMNYGAAHIVWCDNNYLEQDLDFCIKHWNRYGNHGERAQKLVRRSVQELKRFLLTET